MVDFCQRLTTAKRRILEDPDLYPEHTRHALPDSDATRMDQKLRRRRVCEKLSQVPGKLDHATIAAYQVEDRREAMKMFSSSQPPSLNSQVSTTSTTSSSSNPVLLGLRAPCASSEDLTLRDSPEPPPVVEVWKIFARLRLARPSMFIEPSTLVFVV